MKGKIAMTIHEKLWSAVKDTKDILDSLNIEYGPIDEVEINFRATSRWGQCIYHRATGTYTVEVSSRLLVDGVEREALLDTLVHEFLHAHTGRMSHTGEWKRCAELVNRKYAMNIKRCTSNEEKGVEPQYKYLITCDKCGIATAYKRKNRVVEFIMRSPKNNIMCKCGKCGSRNFTINVK